MVSRLENCDKLALNTATLGHNIEGCGAGWGPEQILDACAARGLGGVVFWRREIQNAQQTRDHAEALDLPIIGLCRTPYLIGEEARLDELTPSLDMAAALGAPVLTIVVGGIEAGTKGVDASLSLLKKRVEQALPQAEARGVTLALEPLHPIYAANRSALTRARDALNIARSFESPNLKIAIDAYHVWWDTDLPAVMAEAEGYVAGYHICDWLYNTQDFLLDRGMMGDGVVDLPKLRGLVEGAGYEGCHEVEIFSRNNWWLRPPEEVLDVMMERFVESC